MTFMVLEAIQVLIAFTAHITPIRFMFFHSQSARIRA